MQRRPSRHSAVALIATLALLSACADRGTGDHPQPENQPVTAPLPFQVDPAHSDAASCYAVAFAYNQPVALSPQDDDGTQPKPPAARTRPVPVVLDLSCTLPSFEAETPPIDQVTDLRIYNEQQQLLASVVLADDSEASVEHRVNIMTDIGADMKTIFHRRMAMPAAIDRVLRETPGAQLTVVGLDAKGRIALVENRDGMLERDQGIGKGVRVGTSVVWLEQDRVYSPAEGSLYWRFTTSFIDDAPLALPPAEIIGDPSPSQRPAQAKHRAKSPLVLDLSGCTPVYQSEPPLAKAVTLYVFGQENRLLATVSAAKNGFLTSSTCRLSDGDRQTLFTEEHLRTALDPAIFAGMHESDDRLLWVVAIDAEGKTIVADLISAPAVTSKPAKADRSGTLPPPRATIGANPHGAMPASVGTATMDEDGMLKLQLRSEEDDGTIAESLLVVFPSEPRYAAMVAHLGGLKPGGSCSIPPFLQPGINPSSIER